MKPGFKYRFLTLWALVLLAKAALFLAARANRPGAGHTGHENRF